MSHHYQIWIQGGGSLIITVLFVSMLVALEPKLPYLKVTEKDAEILNLQQQLQDIFNKQMVEDSEELKRQHTLILNRIGIIRKLQTEEQTISSIKDWGKGFGKFCSRIDRIVILMEIGSWCWMVSAISFLILAFWIIIKFIFKL